MKKEISQVDIILLTYQRLKFLKETIDEIEKRTQYPYRLIVVDNGSTDGTREWLKELEWDGRIWKYVFMKENCFMAESYARGFEEVESEYFIVTQDDIVPPKVKPCWLTRMVKAIENNKEYTSISMYCGNGSFNKYMKRKYGKSRDN